MSHFQLSKTEPLLSLLAVPRQINPYYLHILSAFCISTLQNVEMKLDWFSYSPLWRFRGRLCLCKSLYIHLVHDEGWTKCHYVNIELLILRKLFFFWINLMIGDGNKRFTSLIGEIFQIFRDLSDEEFRIHKVSDYEYLFFKQDLLLYDSNRKKIMSLLQMMLKLEVILFHKKFTSFKSVN